MCLSSILFPPTLVSLGSSFRCVGGALDLLCWEVPFSPGCPLLVLPLSAWTLSCCSRTRPQRPCLFLPVPRLLRTLPEWERVRDVDTEACYREAPLYHTVTSPALGGRQSLGGDTWYRSAGHRLLIHSRVVCWYQIQNCGMMSSYR